MSTCHLQLEVEVGRAAGCSSRQMGEVEERHEAYFEKEVYFGRRPIFGEGSILGKTYFWKGRPNFGARNRWQESNMQKKKEKQHARGKATWHAGRQA
jgi:hypothetical protein